MIWADLQSIKLLYILNMSSVIRLKKWRPCAKILKNDNFQTLLILRKVDEIQNEISRIVHSSSKNKLKYN